MNVCKYTNTDIRGRDKEAQTDRQAQREVDPDRQRQIQINLHTHQRDTWRKRESNPGSAALKADALTTRPRGRWGKDGGGCVGAACTAQFEDGGLSTHTTGLKGHRPPLPEDTVTDTHTLRLPVWRLVQQTALPQETHHTQNKYKVNTTTTTTTTTDKTDYLCVIYASQSFTDVLLAIKEPND